MQKAIKKELTVKSKPSNLNKVRKFMIKSAESSLLKKVEQYKVVVAVDEAVTNVMEHGYGYNPKSIIEIAVEADNRKFQVTIRDSGKTFEPDEITDPDIEKYVEKGERRGLGMFLMRKIMDEIQYSFTPGEKNELRMVKYCEAVIQG